VPASEREEVISVFPYRSLCGKLRYLMLTRPEIEYALNQCCRFQDRPTQKHVDALLEILGYLAKFPDQCVTFWRKHLENAQNFLIEGMSDSSHGDNLPGRRSSFGFIVMINSAPIAWSSRVTPMCAFSATEAEYVALAELTKEMIHLRAILENFGFPVSRPMITKTDSNGAMNIATFPQITSRSKHIDLRYHFIREKVKSGDIKLMKIGTSENVADIFMKNLGPNIFWKHVQSLSNPSAVLQKEGSRRS